MASFGQRLRDLRKSCGISQSELSKHIGVSKSSVNMYERDEREPGFETLEAIADFFNVNMDYLLGREHRISVNTEPERILFEGKINGTVFSDSAKPTLAKFATFMSGIDSPDFWERADEIRAEVIRTFSAEDLVHLKEFVLEFLAAIQQTKENFVQNVDISTTVAPQTGTAPQEGTDPTPAADAPEKPTEGE